jgi:cyclic beta-1,2-glucan synthetase
VPIPSGPDGPTRGYGIIQPSMRPTARGNQQSLFSALLTWQQSLVDYNSPAPNPLQDAFGETVFMGKGVYDIAVYGEVLNQRLPEDAVLSHDIIEGAYVRTGSATDVKLLEGLPTSFALFSRRGHRWMRGDWQNIVWLLRPRDKSGRGGAVTGFYRWAIFHNLKRSLREIALVVVLLIVWLSPHANIKLSTWILLILFAGPSYFVWLIGSALIFYKFRFHQSWFSYFVRKSALSLAGIFLRQVLQLSFLAYQSLIAIDAISRALLRLLTRKKLLEWASMQQTETEPRKLNIVDVYLRSMPLFSAIVLFAVVLLRPSAFWYSAPLALCWTISPPLSTWIGTPNKQKHMRSARGFKVK